MWKKSRYFGWSSEKTILASPQRQASLTGVLRNAIGLFFEDQQQYHTRRTSNSKNEMLSEYIAKFDKSMELYQNAPPLPEAQNPTWHPCGLFSLLRGGLPSMLL